VLEKSSIFKNHFAEKPPFTGMAVSSMRGESSDAGNNK